MICPHGDRFCPCPDGALCHYEGHNPAPSPKGLPSMAAYRSDVADVLLDRYGADLPSQMKPEFEEALAAARLARTPPADHAETFAVRFGLQPLPSRKAA